MRKAAQIIGFAVAISMLALVACASDDDYTKPPTPTGNAGTAGADARAGNAGITAAGAAGVAVK